MIRAMTRINRSGGWHPLRTSARSTPASVSIS